jgi:hypothetical protein
MTLPDPIEVGPYFHRSHWSRPLAVPALAAFRLLRARLPCEVPGFGAVCSLVRLGSFTVAPVARGPSAILVALGAGALHGGSRAVGALVNMRKPEADGQILLRIRSRVRWVWVDGLALFTASGSLLPDVFR